MPGVRLSGRCGENASVPKARGQFSFALRAVSVTYARWPTQARFCPEWGSDAACDLDICSKQVTHSIGHVARVSAMWILS
jgi:hypothetical protein